MKPIVIRTLSGGIYTLLTIVSIFLGAKYFGSFLLILLFLGLLEFHRMLSSSGNIKLNKAIFIIVGIVTFLIPLCYLWKYIEAEFILLVIPIIFLLCIVCLVLLLFSVFVFVYCLFCLYCFFVFIVFCFNS